MEFENHKQEKVNVSLIFLVQCPGNYRDSQMISLILNGPVIIK